MTQDGAMAESAVEAVRCVFLARVLEKQGYPEAARQWQARAVGWLKRAAVGRDGLPAQTDKENHAPALEAEAPTDPRRKDKNGR